jgi:3-phosphoinositide dependent protein kinase-1
MTHALNGDLLPFINVVGAFDLNCTRFYAAQLVLALEEMHKRGIVHRDLKPENILLDENLHILVADFGSAKIFTAEEIAKQRLLRMDNRLQATNENEDDNPGNRTRSFVGTAQYVSPEILKGLPTSRATDLWALGCIIYQMISGLPSFCAPTEYLIFQKILKLDLKFPDGFDATAQDLVQKLLRYEPHTRIGSRDAGDTYTSIRSHPFFNGISFETIHNQPPPPILASSSQSVSSGSSTDESDCELDHRLQETVEPGLGDKQLKRLISIELGRKELVMDDDQEIEIAEEPKSKLC